MKIIVILILMISVIQQSILLKGRKKQYQTGNDEFTEICNLEQLNKKAKRLKKCDQPICVIYSDIAEFKLINELFGRRKEMKF